MIKQSQSQLEKLIHEQEFMALNLNSVVDQEYEIEDWIVEMGQRKALLVPKTKQWMWYDRLHDEWQAANCGIDEAILLTLGKVAGMKRLPIPGDVSEWCVYMQGQQLFGPLRTTSLVAQMINGQIPFEIKVWSPLATSWLTPIQGVNSVTFIDENGESVVLNQPKQSTQSQVQRQHSSQSDQPPAVVQSVPMVPPPAPSVPPMAPPPLNFQPPVFNAAVPPKQNVFEVIVLNGELSNKHFSIVDILKIGREFDNDLILSDQKVSRHHAFLQNSGGVLHVTDLNSSNGTLVNGIEITAPTALKHGDILLVGTTQLEISIRN